MKTKTKIKILTAAGLLTIGLNAQAVVIDLFTDPVTGQFAFDGTTGDGGNFDQIGPFPTSIIGSGYRDIYVEKISATGVGLAPSSQSTISIFGGQLSFSNDSQVVGQGTVQYDGNDNSPVLDYTGLGGVDMRFQDGCPTGGCDRIDVTTIQSDLGPWAFTFGLYTDANNWSEFDLIATPVGPGGLPSPHYSALLFADFENAGTCGQIGGFANPQVLEMRCGSGNTLPVDVTNLGALQYILNVAGPAGSPVPGLIADLDVTLSGFTKSGVPEPSTIGMIGLGLIISGFARIKRGKGRA